MFKTSPLYLANLNATEDIVVNQGGTSSGKTYALMQVLFSIGISQPNKIITATAESVPHIERGLLRDAQAIIASSPELESHIVSYNIARRIYTLTSGSIIEMPVFPDVMSAHGPKRDYLAMNEAPSFPFEIFEQLMERTRIRTFLDYNPSAPFWAHNKLLSTKKIGTKSVKLIISDHRHNPFLTQAQHDHIEARALEDPEWGRVYARGLTGKIEGLIFRNWDVVDKIPDGASRVAIGMDFGYTNDPTAIVDVRKMDNELYVDLLCYEPDLTNPKIAEKLKALNISNNVVADSAEPKSIAEIRSEGIWVEPAEKGKDSVGHSIDVLKRYKLHVTSRSQPLIAELNAYKWKEDRLTGLKLREPADRQKDHAIDALRYVALNKLSTPNTNYSIRA